MNPMLVTFSLLASLATCVSGIPPVSRRVEDGGHQENVRETLTGLGGVERRFKGKRSCKGMRPGKGGKGLAGCSSPVRAPHKKIPIRTPSRSPASPPPAPTPVPTRRPSQRPTKAPTQAPTEAPTDALTEAPTPTSTYAPTPFNCFSLSGDSSLRGLC